MKKREVPSGMYEIPPECLFDGTLGEFELEGKVEVRKNRLETPQRINWKDVNLGNITTEKQGEDHEKHNYE